MDQPPHVVALAVGGADLLDALQRLRQRLLEGLVGAVLVALQLFDLAAENRRDVDDDRIEQQDEQRELPVHPQQHERGPRDAEHRDQQLAGRDTDELVDGVEIGHEVRGHGATAQGLVLGHRHPFEAGEQVAADAKHHVLGDGRELAGLPDAEHEVEEAQEEGERQHGEEVERRTVPARGEDAVHQGDGGPGLVQQHLVHQEGDEERHGHGRHGAEDGDHVGDHELPAVREDHPGQRLPAVGALTGLVEISGVRHRRWARRPKRSGSERIVPVAAGRNRVFRAAQVIVGQGAGGYPPLPDRAPAAPEAAAPRRIGGLIEQESS